MSFKSWFNKRMNGWFTLMVIAAFIGMISYFQINSYSADKHHLNTVWLINGIVFTIAAIICAVKANQTSSGQGG